MKRDIHKFSAWLEKTVRAGIADERTLRELKLAQKPVSSSSNAVSNESPKAR